MEPSFDYEIKDVIECSNSLILVRTGRRRKHEQSEESLQQGTLNSRAWEVHLPVSAKLFLTVLKPVSDNHLMLFEIITE